MALIGHFLRLVSLKLKTVCCILISILSFKFWVPTWHSFETWFFLTSNRANKFGHTSHSLFHFHLFLLDHNIQWHENLANKIDIPIFCLFFHYTLMRRPQIKCQKTDLWVNSKWLRMKVSKISKTKKIS